MYYLNIEGESVTWQDTWTKSSQQQNADVPLTRACH
jgi:hypothetical protein